MTHHDSWKRLIEHLSQIKTLGPSDPGIYGGYLESLPGFFRELGLFRDTLGGDESLAHYTSWEKTVEILGRGIGTVIRMYNYELANDPREGQIPRKEWEEVEDGASWLNEALSEPGEHSGGGAGKQGSAYGCSFSSGAKKDVGDNLTFWRLYGNNGDGCSFLVPATLPDMYRVRYYDDSGNNLGQQKTIQSDKEMTSLLNQVLQIGKQIFEEAPANEKPKITEILARNIRRLLTAYCHLAKSHYYQDEREWRMIRIAPKGYTIHFDVTDGKLIKRYINGPPWDDMLRSGSVITIGPCVRNQAAARAYIEERVKSLGLSTKVAVSKKEYRLV